MSCPHSHPRCPCAPDLPRDPPRPPNLTEMEDTMTEIQWPDAASEPIRTPEEGR